MARPEVLQGVQVGVESAKGTAVAAALRFLSTKIEPVPHPVVRQYRSAGGRFNTAATAGKDHTTAAVSGPINYNELGYLLPTLLFTEDDASPFTFLPTLAEPDDFSTLTVETGNGVQAEKFSYGNLTRLGFRFTQDEAGLTGDMLGQALGELITITADPVDVPEAVLNPSKASVYLASSVAGLSAGKITNCMNCEINIGAYRKPFFVVDGATTSFRDTTDLAPEMTATLVLEHNSVAAGYMTQLRAATQRFLRVAVAETIGGDSYALQITAPFWFLESGRGGQDDVHASTYRLGLGYESGLASAIEIVLTNTIGA